MKIGAITISNCLTLAPMEEHTNFPFRLLMKQAGAGLVVTERTDAADLARHDRRAMRLLYTQPSESPRSGQISGADPEIMAAAARVVAELGFNIVDLNFECPVRRLLARGEGGALMGSPERIGRIVDAVVRAVAIPVTIKIRSGPDPQEETAVEVTQRAEDAGAAAVSVHARSVRQAYIGGPDWGVLARVKQATCLPVIGGGGIRAAEDAARMLAETGVDAVSIGRGCLGNPWIFRQARALLSGGGHVAGPTLVERGRLMLQLIEGEFHLYGPPLALRRLPRMSGYFAQALPDAASFRDTVRQVKNLPQFRRIVRQYFGT
ncbi:MAG: tRNA dihydrouridine synthase [Thermoguttaceae bacterium]